MTDFADALSRMDYDGEKIVLYKISAKTDEWQEIDAFLVARGCTRTAKVLEYKAPAGTTAESFLRDAILDLTKSFLSRRVTKSAAYDLLHYVVCEEEMLKGFTERALRVADPLCADGILLEATLEVFAEEMSDKINFMVGMDPVMRNLELASDRLEGAPRQAFCDVKLLKGSHITKRLKRIYDLAMICVPEYRDLLHLVNAWNIVDDGGIMIAFVSEATVDRMASCGKSDPSEIAHINSCVEDVMEIDDDALAIIISKG